MMTLMKAENNKVVLRIEQDMDAESPREWDNLGTMICNHRRYDLGDESFRADDYNGWDDLISSIEREKGSLVYLPLYLYDHSGITMNTTGFHCPWDSGQVGWIYVTKEQVRKEWGVKRVSKQLKEHVIRVLKAEVETYDQYISGEVYGFVLEEKETNDVIDSCWGFYGSNPKENGMLEHIPKEHETLVEELT
jgi:hypothetical protein